MLLAILVSWPLAAAAQGIVNGDFETGDFAGWTLDTDGSSGGAPDFAVVGAPGDRAARIEADYFATPGDLTSDPSNAVFLANTLHQALDTTAGAGETLVLRFDWTFGGEDGDSAGGETFVVGLGDGSGALYGADGEPGHLVVPTRSYGSGSFVAELDAAAFNGVPGWSIEFQLGVGVDPGLYTPNALGSFVEIESVSLPEPGALPSWIAGIGVLWGLRARRRARAGAIASLALAVGLVATGAAPASANWTDVSGSIGVAQTAPEFDRVNPGLASHVTVTNTSGAALGDMLRLVVDGTLPVTNEDGRTGGYEPYFDVPALAPGASTTLRVAFERVRAPLSYGVRLEQLVPNSEALAIVTPPVLVMDPNSKTPLAGRITAETNVAARAKLTISGGSDLFTVEFPEFQTVHELPVLGLKLSTPYTVSVEFTDPNGDSVASPTPLVAATGPLPANFPQVTIFASQPSLAEPGYTLIDRFSGTGGGYATIWDLDGDLVWYGEFGGDEMEQAANGNLELGSGLDAIEVDMLGATVDSVPLQAGMPLHHDLFRTAYGTYLSLGRLDYFEPNYPSSEGNPNTPPSEETLIDELPVELDADGNLMNVWPLSERIDTTRIAYDSLTVLGGKRDWVHANAVWHDPRDDSMLVSLRHQDAVLKISRYTGKLIWILGTHANWKPEYQPYLLAPVGSPFEWQYHQHAIETTPAGTYMLFDNGNRRTSPYDGQSPMPADQSYSRAVEYAVDESTMEITQVWEWGGDVPDPLYSLFISDADSLPQTGNVLLDFGGNQYYDHQTTASQGWGALAVRVVEVTHETPAQKVFDLLMYRPLPLQQVTAYRAEKIPSLYPPNVIVTQGP